MQKFYTADFLNKKLKKNNGEVQQYYISENHEPIIPPDIWDVVQEEIKRRSHCKKGGGDIFRRLLVFRKPPAIEVAQKRLLPPDNPAAFAAVGRTCKCRKYRWAQSPAGSGLQPQRGPPDLPAVLT